MLFLAFLYLVSNTVYFSYISGSFFFIEEFQWFFIELSVLP
jgi:hypothetical protein